MNALDYFFYIFAALAIFCAAMIILNPFSRSPVTSAMCLVLTIISLAGLYVTLHAFFLAAVQILVYAGAVMVLFIFVIMLLDLKEEDRRKIKVAMATLAALATGSIAFILFSLFKNSQGLAATPNVEGSTPELGMRLFTQYTLPFEIVSLLLLVAMIGAIILSKKELK